MGSLYRFRPPHTVEYLGDEWREIVIRVGDIEKPARGEAWECDVTILTVMTEFGDRLPDEFERAAVAQMNAEIAEELYMRRVMP